MIGDALVGAIWRMQQKEGGPISGDEMASLLRVPRLSVEPTLQKLEAEHPYPLVRMLDMRKEVGCKVWGNPRVVYYVTRDSVYPTVVSGKKAAL